MKKTLLVLICSTLFQLTNAQIHEVGIFAGGSNFIGDVGLTNYVSPTRLALGVLYKYNANPYLTWRFSYTQTNLVANDKKSELANRNLRRFVAQNDIKEFAAGLEFNFFKFNFQKFKSATTPYVFTGLSYFKYDDQYFNAGKLEKIGANYSLAIPIALGVKTKISEHLILGVEAGVRFTFTDAIDGSNPQDKTYTNFKFGNINSNDWYTFTGFTLTYGFGQKPCFFCNN